jgi:tRNA threonylcarbamoyl adenosine modification protein (Sua5/YciO/YrdC/YwlC family)
MGKIIRINSQKPERKRIKQAVCVLRRGGLVIFPTDTVYGLGASIRFPKTIRKIYRIKRRPGKKPLVFLIGFKKEIGKFTNRLSNEVKKLIRDFWPGPLTLVFTSKKYNTIALRMPDNRIALRLIRGAGPLAVTSANLSGREENVRLKGMENQLLKEADLSIDGGKAPWGRVSTVLDVTNYPFKMVREGCIKKRELRQGIRDK